jgi:Glycoside Hydrolase Family 113
MLGSGCSMSRELSQARSKIIDKSRWTVLLVLAGVFVFMGIALCSQWPTAATPRVAVTVERIVSCGAEAEGRTSKSYPKLFFQKGVNFTAEYPDIYGSKGADEHLMELKRYGVNAIALVPYGFASENSVRIHFNLGWEKDSGVEQVAQAAHRAGMHVFLKPQLFVREGYPGSLEYPDPGERRQWFARYRIFLEHYATLAARIHADLFCVGVELDKLSPYTQEWRALIARVRELYSGPLVYAANYGDEFESVQFWDALDYIGMDEYYSLPDDLSTDKLVAKVRLFKSTFIAQ